jgi:hypothetical protein
MELALNDRDKRLYTKLFVSNSDIEYAQRCAGQLKKKGWHHRPWDRRGSVYFQQSAFTTALVVAYARVFKRSIGMTNFPQRLLGYSAAEKQLHSKLIALRDEVCAHSDGSRYSIRPWRSGSFSTDIVSGPMLMLSAEDTDRFLVMTERVQLAIRKRMKELLSGLPT